MKSEMTHVVSKMLKVFVIVFNGLFILSYLFLSQFALMADAGRDETLRWCLDMVFLAFVSALVLIALVDWKKKRHFAIFGYAGAFYMLGAAWFRWSSHFEMSSQLYPATETTLLLILFLLNLLALLIHRPIPFKKLFNNHTDFMH